MIRRFVIREFRTKNTVEAVPSFEAGFRRCIELYLRSGKKLSYFVEEVAA